MKNNVLKRQDYLNLLAKSKNKKRRHILIDLADPSEMRALTEVVKNCINGRVPLDKTCVSKLRRHKKKLRLISQKRHPVKSKKSLLKQTGGILSAIIPLAISTVASLVKSFAK